MERPADFELWFFFFRLCSALWMLNHWLVFVATMAVSLRKISCRARIFQLARLMKVYRVWNSSYKTLGWFSSKLSICSRLSLTKIGAEMPRYMCCMVGCLSTWTHQAVSVTCTGWYVSGKAEQRASGHCSSLYFTTGLSVKGCAWFICIAENVGFFISLHTRLPSSKLRAFSSPWVIIYL